MSDAMPSFHPIDQQHGPDQNAGSVLISRIRQLLDRNHFNAAALLLPTLEKRGVDPGIVQVLAASIAFARGDRDAGEQIIAAGLTAHPESPPLLCLRAEMSLTDQSWVEAAKSSAEAVIADPCNAVAKSMLGRALLELGKVEQADACLREALEMMPHDLATLTGLARVAPDQAEAALTSFLDDAAPVNDLHNEIGIHHLLISLLIGRGEYEGATRRIRDLVSRGRATVDTSLLAVQAAVNTGNWVEATSLFNTTTRHLPRHA